MREMLAGLTASAPCGGGACSKGSVSAPGRGLGGTGLSPVPAGSHLPSLLSPATHGRGASEAILAGVGDGKLALPNVGVMLALRLQFVAPGEKSVEETPASARQGTAPGWAEGTPCTGRPACPF